MSTEENIKSLLRRYVANEDTREERQQLFKALREAEYDEEILLQWLDELSLTTPADAHYQPEYWKSYIQKILADETRAPVKKMTFWKRWAVAASILFIIGLSVFIYFNKWKTTDTDTMVNVPPSKDIEAPQSTKATITLADGRVISPDSLEAGTLATQQQINVIKSADGKIIYDGSKLTAGGSQLVYNTLTNPRGSKVIDMTLSDGSHVWLNAGSSVTYPVAFTGNERKVSITGEAYFEVAHDKSKPFFVSKGDMNVQVLGTKFNVNAYDDEADIKVTLLEGSVAVSREAAVVKIKPGQQAVLSTINYQLSTASSPDLDAVMAWKNGLFSFKQADIKTIMRELARWYDLEIEYTTEIKETFFVKIARNTNVSEVFKILETTGAVHFSIQNKKIIVKP